jgi:hypothetical protein
MNYLFIGVLINVVLMRGSFYFFLLSINMEKVFKIDKSFLTVSKILEYYLELETPTERSLKLFRFFNVWEIVSLISIPLFPVLLILSILI